jgi:hypothetical protein
MALAWLILVLLAIPVPSAIAAQTFVVAPDPPRLTPTDATGSLPADHSPKPFRPVNPSWLQAAKAASVPGLPATVDAAPGRPANQPQLEAGFLGIRLADAEAVQGFSAIPPDSQVAAGPSHLFVVVNVVGRILTKAGAVVTTFGLQPFFGVPGGTNVADPRVRYDAASGRWFISAISFDDTGGAWHLAVSKTSTPSGLTTDYNFYTFPTPGELPDYDALGISDDKVILTANAFSCTPSCETGPFPGPEFLVINKAQVVSGAAATMTLFGPSDPANAGVATIQPAMSLSSTTTHFMVAGDIQGPATTTLRIYSVTGVPGVGGGAAVTTVDRSIAALSTPPDAVQQGSGVLVATNDNRFLDLVYRNGVLWATASGACTPAGDATSRACARYVQVNTAGLGITQDFDFATPGAYYYYPAVSLDSAGNLLTVFSRSSASEFASVYGSGRLAVSGAPTLEPPILLKAGEAAYDPVADGFSQRRWGDYSAVALDPAAPTHAWTAGEYARTEGGAEWGVWLSKLTIATMFADVPAGSPFSSWIDALASAGVTTGCGTSPLIYCPASPVTRDQMAVFILKAKEGAGFSPPACGTAPFGDVPVSNPFCPWIKELANRGVVAGCGGGNYCPTSSVTREQMAVFILKGVEGGSFSPPACTTAPFGDVPTSSPFCRWIQELASRGVTTGCGGGNYCPAGSVTRDQMAVFLVKGFGLPYP